MSAAGETDPLRGASCRPTTIEEARAVLGDPASPPLRFAAGRTKQDWRAPSAVDGSEHELSVETTGLCGVRFYDPHDAVAGVGAGTRLDALQAVVAEHGQWLAIDPPLRGEGATVGGIFSVDHAGPRRLAYGTLRDLVIGCTVVTGDGVIAHAGGRVIKNVAGYDLCKLYCGAAGTLGLVVELVVRLHPIRRFSSTLVVPSDPSGANEISRAVRLAHLELTSLQWCACLPESPEPAAGSTLLRVEQRTERPLTATISALRRLVTSLGLSSELLSERAAAQAWTDVEAVAAGAPGETVLAASLRPSRLPLAVTLAVEAGSLGGCDCALSSSPILGLLSARLAGGDHSVAARHLRSGIERLGGHLRVLRRGTTLEPSVSRLGTIGATAALMRRIKTELDPFGHCEPMTLFEEW